MVLLKDQMAQEQKRSNMTPILTQADTIQREDKTNIIP
jgi:hypothetical protein